VDTEIPHWQLSVASPQDKRTKGHIFAHKQEFYKDHGSLKKNPVAEDHHCFQIPMNDFDAYAHLSFYAPKAKKKAPAIEIRDSPSANKNFFQDISRDVKNHAAQPKNYLSHEMLSNEVKYLCEKNYPSQGEIKLVFF
jgi:hypothetical protein